MKQIRNKITTIFKQSNNCIYFVIFMASLMFISIYRDEIRLKLNSVLENYQPSGQPNVSQKDANSASTKLEADLKQLEQLKSDNDYLLQLSEMDEEAQMRAKLDKYELLFIPSINY